MIISPPFLPSQPSGTGHEMDSATAGNTVVPDHDICRSGMQECAPGNGAYPVSYSLGWHGGPHLVAPKAANGQSEPVRAIADGEVVYVRQTDAGERPALQYRNVRTDDGCVVIKHTTEIGEGDSAKVTFYSIYMHLQSVTVKLGKPVYRKDLLGMPGQIYGQRGQIHFEIVCDTANLKKLVGRTTGPLTATQGRTDAIYGDIWFKVPKGLKFFANRPHPYRRDDTEPPHGPHPSVQTQPAAGTTAVDLLIQMHYERGDCTLTTFTLASDGRCVRVGEPVKTHGYEYSLYAEAMRLNRQYRDGSTNPAAPAPAAPAPSLIYEMLRLGRAIGEPMPANVKFGHWRKIATPDGTGWINLNAPKKEGHHGATPYAGISVYSDADFPHWAGWSLIDDDATPDSLCESSTIKRWLDLDGDGQVTHAEAKEALHSGDVRKRMAQAICKFPVEWAKQDIDARWGWLKSPHEALAAPLTGEDFDTLKAHIEALAFWEDIQAQDLPPAAECWHLPPKAFIEHFRKCGWISARELAQCIPRRVLDETRDANRQKVYPRSAVSWRAAIERATRFSQHLNLSLRRYGISATSLRTAYFLANAIQETIYFTRTSELGGAGTRYAPWYGRGLLQLTWEENYVRYGKFRGFSVSATMFRDSLKDDLSVACDSAGFYWVSCAKEPSNALDINTEADENPVFLDVTLANVCDNYDYHSRSCVGAFSTLQIKDSPQLERVARAVNTGAPGSTGAVNGLVPRGNVFLAAVQTLTDIIFDDIGFVAQRD
ncbi:hypothetical protein WS50_22170 [Burkholderia territorii]|uniref:peptidoglycan DD-metalloendopeptidase family protein n=1 Tax=Burkholderia territorii TaxID=1503055 RepID=UPI000758EE86|nr:peptidoglycan DD-metalloendopeptidase family protein [Burkholderia territorii]KUZ08396.1 hypothetical protein WS50_22170 [Burkholderia territorii]